MSITAIILTVVGVSFGLMLIGDIALIVLSVRVFRGTD